MEFAWRSDARADGAFAIKEDGSGAPDIQRHIIVRMPGL